MTFRIAVNTAVARALVLAFVLGATSRAGAHTVQQFGGPTVSSTDRRLIEAATKGDAKEAKQLLAEGADPNAVRLGYRKAPLHLAAERGHVGIVRILLAAGADVNHEAGEGQTPLFLAVRVDRNLGIQRALLGEGRSSLPVNTEYVLRIGRPGGTPLSLPVQDGFKETIAALVAAGARDALYGAAALGDAKQVKPLLANGADANEMYGRCDTALHAAAERGHKDIVVLQIAAGADVNAETEHAQTPIELGVVMGHKGIVALLIAGEAEVPEKFVDLKTDPEVIAEMQAAKEALRKARAELDAARKAQRAAD